MKQKQTAKPLPKPTKKEKQSIYFFRHTYLMFSVFSVLPLFITILDLGQEKHYTLASFGSVLHFLIIAVAIATLAPLPPILWIVWKRSILKFVNRAYRFVLPILLFVSAAITMTVFLSFINCTQYRPTETETVVAEVEEAVVHRPRGKYDHDYEYSFTVDLDGKSVTLYVSEEYYEAHKNSNTVTVYCYKGALGEPYFTLIP